MSVRRKLPWGDYMLRPVFCALLFITGFTLLANSTFVLRMRNDIPGFVPFLNGSQSIAFLLALVLGFVPLLAGGRYRTAFAASAFFFSGVGGYWWTRIAWDELLTDSGFPTPTPATWMDFLFVAAPVLLLAFYVVVGNVSRTRSDYLSRGVARDQAARAAAAAFVSGSGVLVTSLVLAAALWAMLAYGVWTVARVAFLAGWPALVLAGVVAVVGLLLADGDRRRVILKRPSSVEARPEDPGRNRGRKSPS